MTTSNPSEEQLIERDPSETSKLSSGLKRNSFQLFFYQTDAIHLRLLIKDRCCKRHVSVLGWKRRWQTEGGKRNPVASELSLYL